MKTDIKFKTFWLTGASSGIGRALAVKLADLDARLILSSRYSEELIKTRDSLKDSTKHRIVELDLSNSTELKKIAVDIVKSEQHIDCLINCAGLSQRAHCLTTSEEVDRAIMEVNYFGTIMLTKLVAQKMVKQKGGTLLSIGSVAGKVGSQNRSAYSAAKHALIGFMDCLRAEVASQDVKVLVVCPGWVKTNISKNALTGNLQPFAKTDTEIENGMPVDQCANKIIKALRSNTEEVIIASGLPFWAYHLHRFMPNLYHRLLRIIYKK